MIFIKKYLSELLNKYKIKWMIIFSIFICVAITYIDVLNIPTHLISEGKLFIIILFSIATIMISYDYNFINTKLNSIDKKLFIILLSVVLLFGYVIFLDYKFYKIIMLLVGLVLTIILQYIRIKIINNSKKEDNALDFNTIDLKDLCDGNFNVDKSKGIFIEEKEVDYDLLDRGNIINQLYNSIIKCKPKESFTIGLNGKWGSGKTTIVNNVLRIMKENEIYDNYIVVKFDPWQYGDEKAILKGLLLKIATKLEITKEYDDVDDMINYIIEAVFSSKSSIISNMLKKIISIFRSKDDLNEIITQKLKRENKNMILIIDNLDRIDNEKAVFLIKSIKTIANYSNTIYLLLYDEEIINVCLNEMFNTSNKYMEKIVQLKIDIGEVDLNVINNLKNKICKSLIENNIVSSEFNINDNCEFKSLRELKRFFNSMLSSSFNNSNLNYEDYVSLEYIKNNNIKLYYEIWNNKKFFIVDDRIYYKDLYTLNKSKLNEETKLYFEELFSNKENLLFKSSLIKMFPTVKNYLEDKEPFEEYRDKVEYQKGILDNRIFNARYFDLYFTNNENEFIILNKNVAKAIELINTTDNKVVLQNSFKDIIKGFDFAELKVFMEILELNMNKIDETKRLNAIICLYKSHKHLRGAPIFGGLDSLSRCAVIISKILIDLSEEEFSKFINEIIKDYNSLGFLGDIKYWLDNSDKKNDKRLEDYEKFYNEICESIYKNKINLYDKKHYVKGNIWALYHHNNESVKQYVLDNINPNNVYKIINDLVSNSIGTRGYGYHINKANINALCPNLEIDRLIENHKKELTKDEGFLKEIYESSKTNENDMDNEIYLDKYVEINDL